MNSEMPAPEIEITIKLQSRPDYGLRVYSDDVPGLILSHSDPDLLMADVLKAIRVLRPDFAAAIRKQMEKG
jgi:hypothetical protein